MNEVEPQDTAMDVLAMAYGQVQMWLLAPKVGKPQKPVYIKRSARFMRQCSDLLAAEIEAADKAKGELERLRKELSERGIDVELVGGRWEWKTE